jgi:hypothetical protein
MEKEIELKRSRQIFSDTGEQKCQPKDGENRHSQNSAVLSSWAGTAEAGMRWRVMAEAACLIESSHAMETDAERCAHLRADNAPSMWYSARVAYGEQNPNSRFERFEH